MGWLCMANMFIAILIKFINYYDLIQFALDGWMIPFNKLSVSWLPTVLFSRLNSIECETEMISQDLVMNRFLCFIAHSLNDN